MIDFSESLLLESEPELPPIEPGLQVVFRDSQNDTVWVVSQIYEDTILATGSRGSNFCTPEEFWRMYKPAELRRALAQNPHVELGLRVRPRGKATEYFVSQLTADRIIVAQLGTGVVFSFERSTFWDRVEPVEEPDHVEFLNKSKIPLLLEIGAELTQIAGLLDELSIGYRNEGRDEIEVYSSRTFRMLAKRRSELRRKLVQLG